MKIKFRIIVMILLYLLTTEHTAYCQKLGTIKNPSEYKFYDLNGNIFIKDRFELDSSISNNSNLALANEYYINSTICGFESIIKNDTSLLVEGEYYIKMADSLFIDFQEKNKTIYLNSFIIDNMNYASKYLPLKFNELKTLLPAKQKKYYFKLNKKIFASNYEVHDAIAIFTVTQQNMLRVLNLENKRLMNKK